MPFGYGTLRTAVRMRRKVSCRAAQRSQLLSKSPTDLRRGLSCSTIWLSYKANLVASWMHLHNCRCFQEHLSTLLQSLRALQLDSRGVWEHLEVFRSTGEVDRSACEVCVWLPDQFTISWCSFHVYFCICSISTFQLTQNSTPHGYFYTLMCRLHVYPKVHRCSTCSLINHLYIC